jgi:hypothetical protein
MIATINDLNLFRVGNQFTHDMDTKRLEINPLVKRCGINPALWFLVILVWIDSHGNEQGLRARSFPSDSIRPEIIDISRKS